MIHEQMKMLALLIGEVWGDIWHEGSGFETAWNDG